MFWDIASAVKKADARAARRAQCYDWKNPLTISGT